ncbi:hypothetical protein QOZ80_7BG0597790 [Eleusine coracana subsp. coracana]|nr:hypothetical protein QOZ80_7BG0597790 [Eleusine coracana subsp. coracana]
MAPTTRSKARVSSSSSAHPTVEVNLVKGGPLNPQSSALVLWEPDMEEENASSEDDDDSLETRTSEEDEDFVDVDYLHHQTLGKAHLHDGIHLSGTTLKRKASSTSGASPSSTKKNATSKKRAKRNYDSPRSLIIIHQLGSRCSPADFNKYIKDLTDDQKTKIKSLGFGGLLQMKCTSVFKQLGVWLLQHYNVLTDTIELPNGQIPVNPKCVNIVLGIPCTRLTVKINGPKHQSIEKLKHLFGVSSGPQITVEHLQSALEGGNTEDKFIIAFILLTLCKIVAPTTSTQPSLRYATVCLDVQNIGKYNWAEHVISTIRTAAASVQDKIKRKKKKNWLDFSLHICPWALVFRLYRCTWLHCAMGRA